MMSKTEIFLLIILAVVLLGSIWFIFSDEIWLYSAIWKVRYFPPSAFGIIPDARNPTPLNIISRPFVGRGRLIA